MDKLKKRNYGIDLLRIVSMCMILILHILGNGGILKAHGDLLNECIVWTLEIAAYCAVNAYALISGYVGIDQRYSYSSIIVLWLRVLFYSVSITICYMIFAPGAVAAKDYLKAVFPVTMNTYWYFTAYFGLYIFMPLLNKGINSMTKRQMQYMVTFLILFFSVLPTLLLSKNVFGLLNGYGCIWLIVLYVIGAYIKKYDGFSHLKGRICFCLYLCMILLTFASKAGLYLLGTKLIKHEVSNMFISYISPTIMFSGIFLLLMFRNLNLQGRKNKVIKALTPLVFSVYLIHTHPLVFKTLLHKRFSFYIDLPAPMMVLAVIGTAVGIFLLCIAIDSVREFIFTKLEIKRKIGNLEKKLIKG